MTRVSVELKKKSSGSVPHRWKHLKTSQISLRHLSIFSYTVTS